MENNPVPPSRSERTLGPRRGRPARPLSPSRASVLERLRDQPEPVTLATLVTATGLHENTVREHLAGLLRDGLVRRHRSEPLGRGRPAWRYESTALQTQDSEYAGLATALAAGIARTSPSPGETARASGEEWGRQLARDRGATHETAARARAHVIDLLDDLGFAPEALGAEDGSAPDEVRLTRCPLLEAANRHQEVVCGVHLGIVRGALSEYGADPAGTELTPFAEPGACRLVVPPLPKDPA